MPPAGRNAPQMPNGGEQKIRLLLLARQRRKEAEHIGIFRDATGESGVRRRATLGLMIGKPTIAC